MKTIQEIKEMLSRSEGQEALKAANEIVENKGIIPKKNSFIKKTLLVDPQRVSASSVICIIY